jgi:hypothetical protein
MMTDDFDAVLMIFKVLMIVEDVNNTDDKSHFFKVCFAIVVDHIVSLTIVDDVVHS